MKLFPALCVLLCLQGYAQKRMLRGIVRDAVTLQALAGVRVYHSYDQTLTDSLGRYELEFKRCANCKPGHSIRLFTYSEAYGSYETPVVIPQDEEQHLPIPKQPDWITVNGFVLKEGSGEPLPSVQVLPDYEKNILPDAITDSTGFFSLRLEKKYLSSLPYIRLRVVDKQQHYQPRAADWEVFSIYQVGTILMMLKPYKKLQIGQYRKTEIMVNKGDEVTIRANGFIRTGMFDPANGPQGLPPGSDSLRHAKYIVSPGYRFGALLYRISTQKKWRLAATIQHFVAEASGYLYFTINDKYTNDNEGFFEVEITIGRSASSR
jgi:hypothetical protein